MNIYLDIDGVILANDKQAALHADAFIAHIVENFPVYWLTTHCMRVGDDPIAEEREVLAQRGVLDSWVEIDLAKDPHQLREVLKHAKSVI